MRNLFQQDEESNHRSSLTLYELNQLVRETLQL